MIFLYVIHIAVVGLISWWYYQSDHHAKIRRYYWYGISFNLTGGLILGAVYKIYFDGGDTWAYFQASETLAELIPTRPLEYLKILVGGQVPQSLINEVGFSNQPRALLMVKLLSVFTFLTGGSYWLSSVYLSLFSFFGLWTLVDQVANTYSKSYKAALAAFIFYPGVVFWASGISKEAIFMGGFGFLTAWFWPPFNNKPRPYQWAAVALLLLLLVQLKYYYMAVFISVVLASIISDSILRDTKNQQRHLITWVIVFGVLLFSASWLHPNLRVDHLAAVVKINAQDLLSRTRAPIDYVDHPIPLVWMALNFPWAIVTGLLRPNIGDFGSFLQNLTIVENLVVSILLIGRLKSFSPVQIRSADLIPCLVYILILSGLTALSTPNFGTLVRYKVAYMPVFLWLILYGNSWWNKLTHKLP
ncbi:MAG: hypothetical protein DHS20C17_02430 [Cyclobacteriaceae bacterium]|nr:MAG: hypothetical protein DHS20C17_02430 [Cyclobacteriaceae bacterium]